MIKGRYRMIIAATVMITSLCLIPVSFAKYVPSAEVEIDTVSIENTAKTLPEYAEDYAAAAGEEYLKSFAYINQFNQPPGTAITNMTPYYAYGDKHCWWVNIQNTEPLVTYLGDGEFKIYKTAPDLSVYFDYGYRRGAGSTFPFKAGHQYYLCTQVKCTQGIFRLAAAGETASVKTIESNDSEDYVTLSNYFQFTADANGYIQLGFHRNDNDNVYDYVEAYVKDIYFYDLTELFGAGNEPEQEWCDKYLSDGSYLKSALGM